MAMAVTAGRLLALLPHRVTGIVVACLFLAGSACLWASSLRPGHRAGVDAARQGGRVPSFPRVAGAALGLWAVATVVVSVGAKSLKLIPMTWIRRITATIMLGLAVFTALAAVSGSPS